MLQHNEYETIIVIRPDLDDTVTYGLVEKFELVVTGKGGHLLAREDWGKRKLAYPIQKHQRGHFVLLQHLAPPDLVTELERRIRNEDTVVRFLTTKVGEFVDVPTRVQQAAEQRKIREEQERLRRERGEPDPDDHDLGDDDEHEESDD